MWALSCRPTGGMGNPYEHRDMLSAAYGWSGKTVEQVADEYKARAKDGKKKKTPGGEAPAHAPVRQSELDKMKRLLANAKPRERPPAE